ncbi:hypothetical protein MPSEU_001070700 [Mayamaea pseudoterrestris]|nr:hypothetical protein MPSEU_001070700 [Mayamaea pseudoterrestris]
MMNPYSKEKTTEVGDLESKLQNIAESLRRERGQAHRRKQLVQERLRLAKEEFKAADLSTKDHQDSLNELERKSGDDALAELGEFEKELQEFADKVNFQHKEFLQMREKMEFKIESDASRANKRTILLGRLDSGVGPRREKVRDEETAKGFAEIMDQSYVLAVMDTDLNFGLHVSWPYVLSSKADDLFQESHDMMVTMEGSEDIKVGYESKFGLLLVGGQGDGNDARKDEPGDKHDTGSMPDDEETNVTMPDSTA